MGSNAQDTQLIPFICPQFGFWELELNIRENYMQPREKLSWYLNGLIVYLLAYNDKHIL